MHQERSRVDPTPPQPANLAAHSALIAPTQLDASDSRSGSLLTLNPAAPPPPSNWHPPRIRIDLSDLPSLPSIKACVCRDQESELRCSHQSELQVEAVLNYCFTRALLDMCSDASSGVIESIRQKVVHSDTFSYLGWAYGFSAIIKSSIQNQDHLDQDVLADVFGAYGGALQQETRDNPQAGAEFHKWINELVSPKVFPSLGAEDLTREALSTTTSDSPSNPSSPSLPTPSASSSSSPRSVYSTTPLAGTWLEALDDFFARSEDLTPKELSALRVCHSGGESIMQRLAHLRWDGEFVVQHWSKYRADFEKEAVKSGIEAWEWLLVGTLMDRIVAKGSPERRSRVTGKSGLSTDEDELSSSSASDERGGD